MTGEQLALLAEWGEAVEELVACKAIIERERVLRAQAFASFFPKPEEGTQYFALANGWRLKGVHKIDRKIDEAALDATTKLLKKNGISVDTLIEYKPSLRLKEYKGLTAEQRKLFDAALIAKPASPTVELVPPPKEAQ